jgi:cob(I)alamin adenosyltransferase
MGKRLSKIITRTGDNGTTSLGDGSRVAKDDARIEAIGAVDELNSLLGLLLTHDDIAEPGRTYLGRVQHELFDLGGELSLPDHTLIKADTIERLEKDILLLNESLPPLKEFILPGGNPAAAACHVARTVCRRAERRVVTLARQTQINEYLQIYLNRLSDLLFVIARILVRSRGEEERQWQHDRH